MLDQVEKLKQTAMTAQAIYDGQDEEILKLIKDGNCEIIVVDEAHCVVHWGTADQRNATPFRKRHGNLVKMKSLLNHPRMAVFTATATKTKKSLNFAD
eukprot:gene2064-2342_t